jgi:hypothetical protein
MLHNVGPWLRDQSVSTYQRMRWEGEDFRGRWRTPASLRREAQRILGLHLGRRLASRIQPTWERISARRGFRDVFFLAIAVGLLFVPIPVHFGLFGHPMRSDAYLATAWQVVASALGLAVAIISVLFAALLAGTTRTLGVSLVDFATESGVMAVIRLGVATLLVVGGALLPLGYGAPGGWAALWSLVLCALALAAVLWVFERAVVSLDAGRLASLRVRKVRRAVHAALNAQLITQAGEMYLQQHAAALNINRELGPRAGDTTISPRRPGQVRDVKLRLIRRCIAKEARSGRTPNFRLLGLGVLNREVDGVTELMAAVGSTPQGALSKARRAFAIRRWVDRPGAALKEELGSLHRLAIAAIRESDRGVWDRIADAYEGALLEMPRAVAEYGLPFAGAVAAPGPWGLGPLDEIQRYIYDEVETAVRSGDRSLALHVAYLPMRIAMAAVDLNAPALVNAMLTLYPSLYLLAGRTA